MTNKLSFLSRSLILETLEDFMFTRLLSPSPMLCVCFYQNIQ